MSYIPKHEGISGSDLTGVDGAANRTYELSNDAAISAQMQLVISNTILQIGTDFSFDTGTNTITFLNNIWDDQIISLDYFIDDSTDPVTTANYATTLQITRYSGMGVEIFLEELGTGDSSERSFDAEYGNIIDDSYTLYYGADGSNNLTELIESTDYAIYINDGRIYLTPTGLTKLGTNKLFISYVYSPKQSDTVLASYLVAAKAEVDKATGNYWGTPITRTEYFDGYASGYPHTDRPFGNQIEEDSEVELYYKGIQSITSVEFLDRTGEVTSEPNSEYFRFDDSGRLIIGPVALPNGKRNIKIVYVAGYDEVPEQIQELTALVAGLMALVNISGGSYKDVSTYTLGRKTFSIGQVYVNIRESIDQMKNRIALILDDMGPRYAIA